MVVIAATCVPDSMEIDVARRRDALRASIVISATITEEWASVKVEGQFRFNFYLRHFRFLPLHPLFCLLSFSLKKNVKTATVKDKLPFFSFLNFM